MNFQTQRLAEMAYDSSEPGAVAGGLNLFLELEDPQQMRILLSTLFKFRRRTNQSLRALNFIHTARFLPTPDGSALQVITVFDGELEPYINDFTATIGDTFDLIMAFIRDAPPLPVRDNPVEFLQFIKANNKVLGGVVDPWPVYSAYPEKTVLDIVDPADLPPRHYEHARPFDIDKADIQANTLEPYRARVGHHFALEFETTSQAQALISALTSQGAPGQLEVTSLAASEELQPAYCLTIGLTHRGLATLGVPAHELTRFPAAFSDGPAHPERAKRHADTGANSPDTWILGHPGQAIDCMVSILARKPQALIDACERLTELLNTHEITTVWSDCAAVPATGRGHFGYREGIAQPQIAGLGQPPTLDTRDDCQPKAGVGEFLLGTAFLNAYGAKSIGKIAPEIGQNGTFAAIRLMRQDVDAFDKLLQDAARQTGISEEAVAARLMGRWRNGTPLSQQTSLCDQQAGRRIDLTDANRFDYAPTVNHPEVEPDHQGAICPLGSHVRRMNPRGAQTTGKPYSRRLIRRGMPYQWPAPGKPDERGLLGVFICADLERQYEFLLQAWAQGNKTVQAIRGQADPIIGNQQNSGHFDFQQSAQPGRCKVSLPQLVTTRGSLYVFMPGIAALRRLAGKSPAEQPANQALTAAAPAYIRHGKSKPFDADYLDVKDPQFIADPYLFYEGCRSYSPVCRIRQHDSYWVFTRELIEEVCETRKDIFLKRPPNETWDRGIFHLDGSRHTEVRGALDEVLQRARDSQQAAITDAIESALDALEQASGRPVDLVGQFAARVPRDAFMTFFGTGAGSAISAELAQLMTIMFHTRDRALSANIRANAARAQAKTEFIIDQIITGTSPLPADSILERVRHLFQAGKLTSGEAALSAMHFLMGGYLSTEFLLTTGIKNLLESDNWRACSDKSAVQADDILELIRLDAPFQLADRFAAEDTQIAGVAIPADTRVVVVYGSANREPGLFENPDEFRPGRPNADKHYGFGHGLHRCIGEPLAQETARLALNRLFARFPKLRLQTAQTFSWQSDPYFRSLKTLQAKLS
ncbi:MAG: cytochrome P450 [Burkholderiaceae bacterium]